MNQFAESSVAPALAAGSLFGYPLLGAIGEGAGSHIYLVRDPSTGRKLALKHVVRKSDKDVRFIDQLVNEWEVGSKIKHPGVRRLVAMKLERSLLRRIIAAGLVMELFEGESLERKFPSDPIEQIDTFIRTAEALAAMHSAGFIHCDLKPANILRKANGEVCVIDLGQACTIGAQKERIQGTPDFISPEQVKLLPLDGRTDIYNLGATMYACLAGQKMPTLYTIKKGENSFLVDAFVKSPRDHNASVPEPLSAFVMECVRTNRDRRPADMKAVIQRLQAIAHGISQSIARAK